MLRRPEFLDNRHIKVALLSATHRPTLPPGTSSGIEPATFQLVEQCLNQPGHRAPKSYVISRDSNSSTCCFLVFPSLTTACSTPSRYKRIGEQSRQLLLRSKAISPRYIPFTTVSTGYGATRCARVTDHSAEYSHACLAFLRGKETTYI